MTARRWVFGAAITGGLLLASLTWLIIFLILAWALCAWRWPFAPCWWCKGRKLNHGSTRKRFGTCRVCKGSGYRQILGSKSLHKLILSFGDWRKKLR